MVQQKVQQIGAKADNTSISKAAGGGNGHLRSSFNCNNFLISIDTNNESTNNGDVNIDGA